MNGDTLIEALDLPPSSRVNQRVPKKMLLEHGAPTASDKRLINDGIEELMWLAALKPTTIGVSEYRDDVREYLEIAVLRLTLRPAAKTTRLVELVHRAVPYPLLMLTVLKDNDVQTELSTAHIRWSQGEAGKMVLEGNVVCLDWDAERDGQRWPAFLDTLSLGKQPRATLHTLYQGWIDTLLALHAARVTGVFALTSTTEHAVARRDALQESKRLDTEIARLRAAAAKEKQMSRRVELNLELKSMEAAQAAARAKL